MQVLPRAFAVFVVRIIPPKDRLAQSCVSVVGENLFVIYRLHDARTQFRHFRPGQPEERAKRNRPRTFAERRRGLDGSVSSCGEGPRGNPPVQPDDQYLRTDCQIRPASGLGSLCRRETSPPFVHSFAAQPLARSRESFDHRNQRIRRNERLFQNSIRTDPLRFSFIERIKGPGKQNHRNVSKSGVSLDIFTDLVAIPHRHENIG